MTEQARNVFDIEIRALNQVREHINESFEKAVKLMLDIKGHVVVTGVGKSFHIASKVAASISSLGKPSFALHPSNASHGDLGMITKNDVLLAFSNSGESDELIQVLQNVKIIGASIIAVTSNGESSLARVADIVCKIPPVEEACHLRVAPTSSSTSALVYGDALAVALSAAQGFTKTDYALFHPAGALGKRLILCVSDLMSKASEKQICINKNDTVSKALSVIGENGLGAVAVLNDENILEGMITSGDLRRAMKHEINIYNTKAASIMKENPLTVADNLLAVDALVLMRETGAYSYILPVLQNGNVMGIITMNDILTAGVAG